MNQRLKSILPIVGCAIVLGCILLQFLPRPHSSRPTKAQHLEELLPAEFPGWEVKPLQLGQTEAVQEATDKILQFDDHAFVRYQGKGKGFEVYAAYWGPGKMPVQLVGIHSPDRCWVENGWGCTNSEFAKVIQRPAFTLQPAESRTFTLHNQVKHVLFWHLVDGEVASQRKTVTTTPDPAQWMKGFWNHLWAGQPEQYFIRISSKEPIDQLWREPLFLETIDRLGTLGLAIPPATQT